MLGVPPTASDAEIKAQYFYKAQLLHPDMNIGKPERVRFKAEEEFKLVNEANTFLTKPSSRTASRPTGQPDSTYRTSRATNPQNRSNEGPLYQYEGQKPRQKDNSATKQKRHVWDIDRTLLIFKRVGIGVTFVAAISWSIFFIKDFYPIFTGIGRHLPDWPHLGWLKLISWVLPISLGLMIPSLFYTGNGWLAIFTIIALPCLHFLLARPWWVVILLTLLIILVVFVAAESIRQNSTDTPMARLRGVFYIFWEE